MAASPPDTPPLCVASPDVDTLRDWMLRMIAALRFAELVATIVSFLVRVRDLNTELSRKVALAGRRKPPSETLARLECQLVLAFPDIVARTREPKKRKNRRRGEHPGRASLPAHLPRIRVLNLVEGALRICSKCGAEMTTVGHDICETLDIIPARLIVKQRLDETVACPNDDTIVSASPPPELVPRGKLERGLIVESLLDKYVEHQPVERQCTKWERTGVHIATQTLGRSIAVAIDTLGPIAELICAETRASALLSTDATGLRVLDRDHSNGVRMGTVWCWIGDARWVSFVYAAEADAAGFKSFLAGEIGRTIQCDGTNTTTCIERAGGKRPGCWSHARRGLVEAAKIGDLAALEGLEIIGKLFAVERFAAKTGLIGDARKTLRLEHSAPVLDELAAWREMMAASAPPKTPLGKALGYLQRQWKRLILFQEDGRIELTNNHVERELRRLVLGRKNWLFVDKDLNGRRTASILTIIGTCIAQGINPRAYLHLVTKLIVEKWPRSRYGELLPSALAVEHSELRLPSPPRRALSPPS